MSCTSYHTPALPSTFTDPKSLKFLRRLVYEFILHCVVRLGRPACRLEWRHWPGKFAVTRQHINRTLRELIARGIIEEIQDGDYRAFRPCPVPQEFQKCSAEVPANPAPIRSTCVRESKTESESENNRQDAVAVVPPLVKDTPQNFTNETGTKEKFTKRDAWKLAYDADTVSRWEKAIAAKSGVSNREGYLRRVLECGVPPPADTERRERAGGGESYPVQDIRRSAGFREWQALQAANRRPAAQAAR